MTSSPTANFPLPRRRAKWPLILLLGGAAGIVMISLNHKESVHVKVTSIKRGRVEEIVTATAVGTVEAEKQSTLSAEIQGKILRIATREGAIAKDTVVIELDPGDLLAQRTLVQRDLDVSKLRLDQAVLRKQKIIADLERLESLQDNVISQQQIDQMEKDRDIADKDEEIFKAQIESLRAQFDVVDRTLSKTRIYAPYDGTIAKLFVEEGEIVTPSKPLLALTSSGPLLIRAPIDEVDMGRIDLAKPVRARFDTYPNQAFDGTLSEILPTASTDAKNNRTVDVKARLALWPANIRVGMSAHLEIRARWKENASYLPTNLIYEDPTGSKFVYIVSNGAARRCPVKTGLWNWEYTEIVDGLGTSELVIIPLQDSGEIRLADGTPILISNESQR